MSEIHEVRDHPQSAHGATGDSPAAIRAGRVGRLFANTAPWYVWLLLIAVWFGLAVGTLVTRTQYIPDSRYYVSMSYHFLGESEEQARQHIVPLDKANGWATPDAQALFHWGLVQPRVLYPALSAPFVAVLGTTGMVVIPMLSMAVLALGFFAYASRRYGVFPALAASGLLTMSTYMMFFGTAMVTEGLAAALGLAILWTLPLTSHRGRAALVWCGILIVALAFTRQAAILPAAAIAGAWLGQALLTRQWRNRWAPFAIVAVALAVVTQAIQTLVWPSYSIIKQFKTTAGADTLIGAVGQIPFIARHILWVDTLNYLAHDRGLLVLLAAAVVGAVVLWRRPESHLFLGMMAAACGLNILNGTATAFRYHMPGLAFVLLIVAALAHELWCRIDERRAGVDAASGSAAHA